MHLAAVPNPKSLIDGVEQVVIEILGITGLRHRSALHRISAFDGTILVEAIHRVIESNYARAGASANTAAPSSVPIESRVPRPPSVRSPPCPGCSTGVRGAEMRET